MFFKEEDERFKLKEAVKLNWISICHFDRKEAFEDEVESYSSKFSKPELDDCDIQVTHPDLGETLLNLSRAWELADTPYVCTLVSKFPSQKSSLTDSQKSGKALGRRLVSTRRRFQTMGQYGQGELRKVHFVEPLIQECTKSGSSLW